MRVKIFRGISTQKVLRDIKKTYGDRAIILSTRTIKENNVNMVEVMVAVEGESEFFHNKNMNRHQKGENLWDKWQNEWQSFKRELFSIFKSHVELNHIPKKYKALLDHLENENVIPEVIFHLYKKIKENPYIKLKELFDFVKKEADFLNSGFIKDYKIHIFSGPSGVGKSTTLLKMALYYKKKHPTHKVCIINGDVFNIKKMFLKYYSELYSLEYSEIKESTDWLKLFSEKKFYEKIFVDLPSLRREDGIDRFYGFDGFNLLKDACMYLVLSPVYSFYQIESYLKLYLHSDIRGIIWTKLDEANKFGNIINTCFYTNIPIFLFSYGPQLKNSLASVNDKILLELILKHKLP